MAKKSLTKKTISTEIKEISKEIKIFDKKLSHVSFLAGIILAIIAGLIPGWRESLGVLWLLLTLGVIVGLLGINNKETTEFLVACIAIMMFGVVGFNVIPEVGGAITAILENLQAFVAPAALILALKTIYVLAEE